MARTTLGHEQTKKESTMTEYKTCTKCGQTKPRKKPYFYQDLRQTDNLRPDCADCGRARSRAYLKNNAQKNRDRVKQWRLDNPEKAQQSKQAYYIKNRDRINSDWKAKYKESPQQFAKSRITRRIRQKLVESFPYTWKQVVDHWGSDCHLCGRPIDLKAPRWTAIKGWENGLHLDHVIRIKDGGADTLENVKPAHGICNIRKH
jgi:hypothetical protein